MERGGTGVVVPPTTVEARMATELQIRAQLDTMRSLPQRLEKLARSLGTVQWPGQPTRLNFPSGLEMTIAERTDLQDRMQALEQVISSGNLDQDQCSKARLSLVTKLLLAYPVAGGSSEAAATARIDMYSEAVADIAPWALDAAIKRWARGDVAAANTDFAPGPGTLRRICESEVQPFRDQVTKIRRLLSAVSIERAMDPAPIEPETLAVAAPTVGKLRLV
jgi:hypothetical protein